MQRTHWLLTILLLSLCTVTCAQKVQLDKMLTADGMKSDFRYLRIRLETTHPGLYARHSKEQMQGIMDSLENTLQQPLPFIEFYKKIAFLIATIGCEHSFCNPGKEWHGLSKEFRFLPFQVYMATDKPFIVINGTADTTIHPGDEMISINGKPINSIKQALYPYMPSDGFMTTSKDNSLSSMGFSILYNLFIDRPESYEVVIKTRTGATIRKQFNKDLSIERINRLAMKNPVNKPVLEADAKAKEFTKHQWRVEFLKPHTALLTIKTFGAEKKKFKADVDSFFLSIRKQQTDTLIINIMHNDGGEEELAAYVMSYLIDTPTRFMNAEYLITDADSILAASDVPREVLARKYEFIEPLKDGRSYARISELARELEIMQPQVNGYHGKVFLLVDGGTASAASTFAAVAQSNNRAFIIGQETSGSFRGGGAVPGLNPVLPYSGITAHTSLVYQEFATRGRDGNRGVIPDRQFVPRFEEVICEYADWKKRILELVAL